MRRGFSIFLILLFGLGPLSAMVDGSEDAGLPLCCRRHGAHHCAMAMQMAAMARIPDPNPAFSAPLTCPNYPGPTVAILMPSHAVVISAVTNLAAVVVGWQIPVLRQVADPSAPLRTHAGRGPPLSEQS